MGYPVRLVVLNLLFPCYLFDLGTVNPLNTQSNVSIGRGALLKKNSFQLDESSPRVLVRLQIGTNFILEKSATQMQQHMNSDSLNKRDLPVHFQF